MAMLLSSCTSLNTPKAFARWQAEWIAPQQDCPPNTWQCYRRQITLTSPPQRAVARIACDSKYWLWINDERVVFEGQAKRGPTPDDTYYDTLDLASHLRPGLNTVAALVWYWGKHGFSHNSSGRAGFLFDASIDGVPLLSDSSWQALVHPAYGATGDPHPNYRLPEHNIRYDAQKELGPWQSADFVADWPPARTFGKPPIAPWNALYPRIIPMWQDGGLVEYEDIVEQLDDAGTRLFICRLPYNAHITPYLKIISPAGKSIDIRTDNCHGGGQFNLRAEYITKDGVQAYESLGWLNGHDVRYAIPEGVEVIALNYRQTGYNSQVLGSFSCNDPSLNTLWQKSFRTLYVTMRDTYMDCPDRERAQWWGDAVNELGEAFYVFDAHTGPLLAKKGIYELIRWQRPDTSLYSPVPAGMPLPEYRDLSYWQRRGKSQITYQAGSTERPDMSREYGAWYRELPMQMLASIGWYGFWTYYWYSGDAHTVIDAYPAVRDYLSLWQLGGDGLVIHREGEWDWPDWGTDQDVAVLDNAWLHLALRAAVEMAGLAGRNDDIEGYRKKMRSIENAFNTAFWKGDRYHCPAHDGATDDRANAMAVVAGLAKPEFYPALKEILRTQQYASPYMEKYVLEALYLMDAPHQAVARMKARYAEQIESPLTTLWEGWGIGEKGYGGGTYNHAWSGGPLTMLSQYAAGIAPTAPGFQTFAVIPQMGPLNEIAAAVPTLYGTIELSLRQDETRFSMRLTVPPNTSAVVGIPQKDGGCRAIHCNQNLLYQDSSPLSPADGVRFEGQDTARIRFCLPPGQWTLVAE